MKKAIALITNLTILLFTVFTGYVYADTLDNFTVSVDKKTVHPEEQVILTVNFGQELGNFKIQVDFDDNLFEYVSTDVGTGSAESDKATIEYTELSTAKSEVKITFKAKKEGITSSNSTEFTVTGTELKSQGGGTTYDNITEGKVETLTVEPIYEDYQLALEHTGDIIAGQEADFVLSYSSAMGRPYAKARLEGEATKVPEGGTVKLVGRNVQQNSDYDIIDDGWGDPQGYAIGGEDVSQELNLKGTFSKAGDYTITLRLIDRASSDDTIVEKAFNFTVKEPAVQPTPDPTPDPTPEPETPTPEQTSTETPTELPKTGINEYVPAIVVFIVAVITFAYVISKINKEN